jgi:hypothetical protein
MRSSEKPVDHPVPHARKHPVTIDPDLERLNATVEDFCTWIESLPVWETRVRDWGPREVLAHLVYWHEYYIAQSRAILAGRPLTPPAGRFADMNAGAAAKFQKYPIATLVKKFQNANRRLYRLAREHDPRRIAFSIKQGSKRWRLSELIPAVEAHIRNHLRALKKASKAARFTRTSTGQGTA